MKKQEWPFLLIGLVLVADWATKRWARLSLKAVGQVEAIPGVLGFRYVQNTGAAFSLLAGGGATWLLAIVSLLLSVAAIAYLIRRPDADKCLRVALSLIAAGGLGNMVDRVALGYVVDFLELLFVRFAVFNLADVAITLGALLIVVSLLRPGGNAHVAR